jgi:guanyl-specific ribonuclease Sa
MVPKSCVCVTSIDLYELGKTIKKSAKFSGQLPYDYRKSDTIAVESLMAVLPVRSAGLYREHRLERRR